MTARPPATRVDFAAIVEGLRLAVFVFRGHRLVYQNHAGASLVARLRDRYHVDVLVMLRDHLLRIGEVDQVPGGVTLLTAARGEPFYVHVLPLRSSRGVTQVAITVRELGIEREAFAGRYRLSRREAEVAELVLRGYGNVEIAGALGITTTTTKRHLTRIFRKVGVDSRTRLVSRLA